MTKTKVYKKLFEILKKHLTKSPIVTIFFFLLIPFHTFLGSLLPRLFGDVIDILNQSEVGFEKVFYYSLVILILMIFKWIAFYKVRYHLMKLSRIVEYYFRNDVYAWLLNFNPNYLRSENIGKIVLQLTSEIEKIRSFLVQAVNLGLNLVFIFIFCTIQMLLIDIELTFIIVTPIFIAFFFLKKKTYDVYNLSKDFQRDLDQFVFFSTEYFQILQLFRYYTFEKIQKQFENKVQISKISYLKMVLQNNKIQIVFLFLVQIAFIFLLVMGYKKILSKEISLGNLISFIKYLDILFPYLFFLKAISHYFYEAWVAFDRIEKIFFQEANYPAVKIQKNLSSLKKIQGSINIKALSFFLKENSKRQEICVFENLNLTIKKGEKVALFGRVGSGKTTLLKLLSGFYEEYYTYVYIDEIPFATLFENNLVQNQIIFLQEEAYIFPASVFWNITLGRPLDQKKIFQAARMASMHNEIIKFPKKYNEFIGPGYRDISGGQRQRIALSRIFYLSNLSIFLLDNPFSNLDLMTEKKLIRNVFQFYSDKTIIITSPKIQNLSFFDRIFYLKNRKLYEKKI